MEDKKEYRPRTNRIPLTVSGNTGEITYNTNRNGKLFAKFSVAQTSRILKEGKWEDDVTTWIRVTCASSLAEHLRDTMTRNNLDKGLPVTVKGWYEQREYQDQAGQRRTTWELRAEDVAVSLRYAILDVHKAQTANGFAGRQAPNQQGTQPQQPAGGYTQPTPQPATAPQPPVDDPWNQPAAPAPQNQGTDGFAQPAPII